MQDIAHDLRLLADLHATELTRERIQALRAMEFPATNEFPPEIPENLLDELACDFADIYLHGKFHSSPQESVWLDDEELVCQQPMFEVREWYARYGLAVPNWRRMADDHLVNQLLFVAFLLEKATVDNNLQLLAEAARFLDEHLLRWLLPFAHRVAQRCATALYAELAVETAMYVEHTRDLLAETLGVPRLSHEEVEVQLQAQQLAESLPQPVKFYPGVAPSW
ncbi:Nitrate reductase delta subunit [Thiothrix caldifontis]|uniref:Nitrate reductase delta subunit n=1 Tax=Thiothrix caldifontis TaxID=525918 RepID=A0A1H4DQG8_9GAMM|nr:molecular chaperone TorD family protein [Thiothrix caldifontis]SEA74768.1 Nitrate reductase delta subunit [Thiothrix caldifontis]